MPRVACFLLPRPSTKCLLGTKVLFSLLTKALKVYIINPRCRVGKSWELVPHPIHVSLLPGAKPLDRDFKLPNQFSGFHFWVSVGLMS